MTASPRPPGPIREPDPVAWASIAMKALVVHSAVAVRTALATLLRREGFEVQAVATGSEGLLRACDGADLLIVDTNLVDINGFEVCRGVKAAAATHDLPVILLSATLRSPEDRERGLASGADLYLLEPLEPDELMAATHRLVRLRRAEASAGAAAAALDFARAIAEPGTAAEVLHLIARRTAALVGVERCAVVVLDAGRVQSVTLDLADGRPAPDEHESTAAFESLADTALVQRALTSRQPVAVDDVTQSDEVPAWWTERRGARSVLVAPLLHGTEPVGVLVFEVLGPARAWRADQVALAATLAAQATLAIENARLVRSAEERSERLRRLGEQARELAALTDPTEVLHAVARLATTVLGARITHVWVDEPAARALHVRGSFGTDRTLEQLSMEVFTIPYGTGVVGAVFASSAPIFLRDVQDDPRWLNRRFAAEAGLHAYAGLPLVAGGRSVGALSILFGEPRQFTREERDVMELLAHHAALAVRRAQRSGPAASAA